jgi:hypothetical protein
MNKTKIHLLAQEALDAFWQAVASRFPDATGGDLSPRRALQLKLAAEDAIEEWIANNVPPRPKDTVTKP